jgi:hypothetical protein
VSLVLAGAISLHAFVVPLGAAAAAVGLGEPPQPAGTTNQPAAAAAAGGVVALSDAPDIHA